MHFIINKPSLLHLLGVTGGGERLNWSLWSIIINCNEGIHHGILILQCTNNKWFCLLRDEQAWWNTCKTRGKSTCVTCSCNALCVNLFLWCLLKGWIEILHWHSRRSLCEFFLDLISFVEKETTITFTSFSLRVQTMWKNWGNYSIHLCLIVGIFLLWLPDKYFFWERTAIPKQVEYIVIRMTW